jgi:hypothetical protein
MPAMRAMIGERCAAVMVMTIFSVFAKISQVDLILSCSSPDGAGIAR